MKPITLHPVSVLVGAALVGLSLLLIGAAQASFGTVRPVPTPEVRLVGEIPAEWWTYLKLNDNLVPTYTVPSDRFLVVTRVTGTLGLIRKNGAMWEEELKPVSGIFSNFANPWTDVGNTRVVARPGDVLSVTSQTNLDIWGYLEPVR